MVLAPHEVDANSMETAILHDGTIHPGGAVKVVTEAAHALDSDLYVGFSGKNAQWWDQRVPNDVTILRRTSRSGTLNDVRTARSMLNLDLREYDVIVSSGPAAKFFQPFDEQLHIHYIHHPPLSSLWFSGGLFSYFIKSIDRVETCSIPHLIANSELTATRVFRHYNRDVDLVISPPVDVTEFSTDVDRNQNQLVMVGRLEERKRPMTAVKAMQELPDYTLKLIGDGPMRKEINRQAPPNVEVLGYVNDSTLRKTIEESVAGLFLAEREDFGITPIEYMAAGTPVVGIDEPNTNNQVTQNTGVLVEPTAEAVAEGVKKSTGRNWNRQELRDRANEYSTVRFRKEISDFVEAVYF